MEQKGEIIVKSSDESFVPSIAPRIVLWKEVVFWFIGQLRDNQSPIKIIWKRGGQSHHQNYWGSPVVLRPCFLLH